MYVGSLYCTLYGFSRANRATGRRLVLPLYWLAVAHKVVTRLACVNMSGSKVDKYGSWAVMRACK